MVCKALYTSEPGVSSEGKLYTDSTLLLRRRHLARRAIAGQNGAVCVVVRGRARKGKQGKERKIRSQSIKRPRSKYMLLKPSKKELKVNFLNFF